MRLHLEASQIILLFGNSDIFTSFFIIVFFIIFMIFIFADSKRIYEQIERTITICSDCSQSFDKIEIIRRIVLQTIEMTVNNLSTQLSFIFIILALEKNE